MSRLGFQTQATSPGTHARAGRFRALHGEVQTPVFMPVATVGSVRGQTLAMVREAGSQVLLANTYHLLLRPGPEVFDRFGGIHRFIGWDRPVLTDSGGFQMFSLPNSRDMSEEGASFRSYVDKQWVRLTPEKSIQMQRSIGSDIMMVLDQCVPSTSDRTISREAMERTHRWALRSLAARGDSPQSMFAIVQGACFADLRRESAAFLTEHPFDGFAIGGLAVGETRQEREDFTELTAQLLPADRPRYLMGVGTPIDLLEAVHRGVDMFDCILPTALAQQGVAFTSRGRVDLRRGAYRLVDDMLDPACDCPTCGAYPRAYLHHLVRTKEAHGWHLVGQHNLHFYHRLTAAMRAAIFAGRFLEFYREQRERLVARDEDHPITHPKRNKRKPGLSAERGDYEVHVNAAGFASIRQKCSGEVMHSVNDPVEEAHRLYVEQSALGERIAGDEANRELVIWDVGLGAATNAMAAIRACESAVEGRAVRIVSFERDLDSLYLALAHHHRFTYLRHPAPSALLRAGSWSAKGHPIHWELRHGDFLERMEKAPAPDLIFYDPFSYRADGPLWTLECFRRLHGVCAGRAVELFTYSASTAVRAALLAAGFYVARGVGSGPKEETTRAFSRAPVDGGASLLGGEWFGRWESSGELVAGGEPGACSPIIRAHPQFAAP